MNGDPMDVFEEMDEVFARIFSRMDREFMVGNPDVFSYRIVIGNDNDPRITREIAAPPSRAARDPVAEVHQVGEETMVITELPGTAEEDIRLAVSGTTLVIDAGDAEHHYHTTAPLPPVDAATMQKSFKNGILEVTFRNLPGSPGTGSGSNPAA
jgi:HSP20 family protein